MAVIVNIKIIDELCNETLIRIKNHQLLDDFPDLKFLINKAISKNDNKCLQSNYSNTYYDNNYDNYYWTT